ncbi:MAG: hypothetical protein LUO80_02115 [Methylococcaceae bacterium]|nr:hypothetical protein [Methylococcaceae bacterium]
MAVPAYVSWMLAQEASALLTRLARVKSFAMQEPMLPAANLLPESQTAIEGVLASGRRELRVRIQEYLQWLAGPSAWIANAEEAHRRFVFLRLRFNAVLNQFDLFNDVITQRSENETGVWLSGLDVVSADALHLPGGYYQAPPVLCYLDRGIGAAIRRARTRLPGGAENPVAVIRVPRERMIGHGIASSLIHEVGHQAAALLDLVNSLRPVLRGLQAGAGPTTIAWQIWERWISEIVADFWSVARVGIASTLGLMGVVGLPRPFVFRIDVNDPHPAPWIRVKLSCALGRALYPHPQWDRVEALWEAYYPLAGLDRERAELLTRLQTHIPGFVSLLVNHRPKPLRGRSLVEVMNVEERQPARLQALFRGWRRNPDRMYRAPPSLVFAVLGQARADGRLGPEDVSALLGKLLNHWALRSTLDVSAVCARRHTCSRLLQQPVLSLRSGG